MFSLVLRGTSMSTFRTILFLPQWRYINPLHFQCLSHLLTLSSGTGSEVSVSFHVLSWLGLVGLCLCNITYWVSLFLFSQSSDNRFLGISPFILFICFYNWYFIVTIIFWIVFITNIVFLVDVSTALQQQWYKFGIYTILCRMKSSITIL